eukprot:7378815-Pyramimonas_sp.AAC.1
MLQRTVHEIAVFDCRPDHSTRKDTGIRRGGAGAQLPEVGGGTRDGPRDGDPGRLAQDGHGPRGTLIILGTEASGQVEAQGQRRGPQELIPWETRWAVLRE